MSENHTFKDYCKETGSLPMKIEIYVQHRYVNITITDKSSEHKNETDESDGTIYSFMDVSENEDDFGTPDVNEREINIIPQTTIMSREVNSSIQTKRKSERTIISRQTSKSGSNNNKNMIHANKSTANHRKSYLGSKYGAKNPKPTSKGGTNGKYELWEFLIDTLMDQECRNIIRWTNTSGTFKIDDTETLSEMWGNTKLNKNPMTYKKLSRSLRAYYNGGMIEKGNGKFKYQFVCDIKEITGYSFKELREYKHLKVKNTVQH